jgi:hypothetical protein
VPASWSATIARCLERDPARRWPTLSAAVRGLRGEEPTTVRSPAPRRPSRLVVLGVVLGLAVIGAAAAREFSRRATLTVADVSPSPCTNTAANDAFRAAMAAHAAGRDDVTISRLDAAMRDAPECAGAALQQAYLSWGYAADPHPRAREAFRLALAGRANLGARDAAFLDAAMPAFSDPSDWKETARRLEHLVADRPGDAELHEALGLARIKAGERAGAVQAFARLRALDPAASMGWVMGAQLAADDDTRVELLRACIRAIPAGVDCRRELGTHYQARGACDEVERLGRELTALAPDVPHGYQLRAAPWRRETAQSGRAVQEWTTSRRVGFSRRKSWRGCGRSWAD